MNTTRNHQAAHNQARRTRADNIKNRLNIAAIVMPFIGIVFDEIGMRLLSDAAFEDLANSISVYSKDY